jgi:methionyl-tRNA formyltransferase
MTLSALLIGNESLTAECGNLWLDRGHTLAAVITREPRVADWAAGRGVRVVAPGAGLADRVAGLSVDWVLSVANLSLVPLPVLARAAHGGVNFHDGPLPAYAGLNAPVWAILNGERSHAVTWHLMTGQIDAGDMLATRVFDIPPHETAFTLNARCFAAALDSFPQVITALEAGGQPRKPQDEGPGQLYRRADRPKAAARLDFTQAAEEVARQVRALDHGGYRNPLAVPKIEAAGRVLAVGSAEGMPGAGLPGTVLAADTDGLVVACGTGALRLGGLRDMDGAAVSPTALGTDWLPSPGADEAARLSASLASVAEAEQRLRMVLLASDPVAIGGAAGVAPDWRPVPIALGGAGAARVALAALRAAGRVSGDVAFSAGPSPAPGYVTTWVPVRLSATGLAGLAEAAAEQALAEARTAGGLAADLALREPGLHALTPPPLALSDGAAPIPSTAVTLTLGGTAPVLWHDATRLPEEAAKAFADRIARMVLAIVDGGTGADLALLTALSQDETARL